MTQHTAAIQVGHTVANMVGMGAKLWVEQGELEMVGGTRKVTVLVAIDGMAPILAEIGAKLVSAVIAAKEPEGLN
jgi:hypothetical protein